MQSRVTRGTLSLLTGMGLRKVVAFLYIMVAARAIPREEFGVFVLFDVIQVSLILLSDFGLMISSTRMITIEDDDEGKRRAIGSSILLRLVTVGLLCILIFPARSVVSHMYKSPLLDSLMLYMPAYLLMTCLNEQFSYILLGLHRHKQMAIGQVIAGITGFIGVILFVWLGRFGVFGLLGSLTLSYAASLIYQYFAVGIRIPVCFNPAMLKKLLRFGLPIHLNSLLTLIFSRLDTYLVGLYSGPSAVACYGVAMKLPDNVRQMFESYRLVYFSTTSQLFASNRHEEIKETLETSIRWAAFVLFGGTLMTYLFGNEVIRVVFSAKYLDSVPALAMLMASSSFYICNAVFGTTLIAAGLPKRVMQIGVVTVIVNVAANLAWIPSHGLMGAVYASLLTNGVLVAVYLWSLSHAGIMFRPIYFLKPVLVFALSILTYSVCPWRDHLGLKLLVGGAFFGASIMLGIVKFSDIARLRESLSKKGGGNP